MTTLDTTNTTNAPEIDLGRLTATDMRRIIALTDAQGSERASLNLDLLEQCIDGGLDAIPLTRLPQYLKALDAALGELFNPKA